MKSLDDLRALLVLNNRDQRRMLPTEDFEQMSRCFVETLKEQLDQELLITTIEAQQQDDFFLGNKQIGK